MNLRTTLLLLILVLGLAGAVFWQKGREAAGVVDVDVPLFEGLDPAKVRVIRIDNIPRSVNVRLERDRAGVWYLTDPIEYPADQGVMNILFQDIAYGRAMVVPEEEWGETELGFDPPEMVLELDEERPDGIEFPAQNWIDYGNGEHGVALLNCGLPGNNVVDGTMLLSLMRCTSIVAYGFGGGYEPGMTSDSGFELGAERTFDYALAPHTGGWESARVYRQGVELNRPLMTRPAALHAGALPTRWGLLEVTDPRVVISALKPGEQGGAVLRVYEATGQGAPDVGVRLNAPVRTAQEIDLMEDPLGDLAVVDGSVHFDLSPFQIKTLRLVLR